MISLQMCSRVSMSISAHLSTGTPSISSVVKTCLEQSSSANHKIVFIQIFIRKRLLFLIIFHYIIHTDNFRDIIFVVWSNKFSIFLCTFCFPYIIHFPGEFTFSHFDNVINKHAFGKNIRDLSQFEKKKTFKVLPKLRKKLYEKSY